LSTSLAALTLTGLSLSAALTIALGGVLIPLL